MTVKHTYCGVTFSLITGAELSARLEEIVDRWGPDWRDDPVKRLVMDTFNECEHFIDHYEDAARLRAKTDHAKAMHKLAASLICPPAVDDDADQRARKAGIGA